MWAILRTRHPLLASKVVMRDYDNVSFVLAILFPMLSMLLTLASSSRIRYTHCNPREQLADADANLEFRTDITGEGVLFLCKDKDSLLSIIRRIS